MDTDLERKFKDIKDRIGFHVGRIVAHPITPPEHVYFSLTNRCNLSCRMCSVYKNPTTLETELPLKRIQEIILEIRQMGIRHVIFSGGDPLMRKDLFDILEFAVHSGLEMVDIITNGTLLTDAQAQALVRMGLNHITFSLDGLSSTNDAIRGAGVFTKAEANIDRINYYKAQLNSATPTVGINFTVMDRNVHDMLPMIEFAQNKECNIIVFLPILFNNTKMSEKKRNDLWLSPDSIEKLEDVVSKVINIKEKSDRPYICTDSKVLKAMPGYFKGNKAPGEFKCYEGFKRIVITCEGELWSCVGMYGDLKQKSLRDIWFSKEAYKVRRQAKVCKEHCLQDCVYFPSDILGELNNFLTTCKKNDGDALRVKGRLLDAIALFKNDVESLQRRNSGNIPVYVNCKRGLMDLFLLRQKVLRS